MAIDTSTQQQANQLTNQLTNNLVGAITSKIKNPALAGAAQSLLNSLLSTEDSHPAAVFQNPAPGTYSRISSVANLFQDLDSNYEFSKTCRFLVNINDPLCMSTAPTNISALNNWVCHAAELPGVDINPIEYRYYGFKQRMQNSLSFGNDSKITLTFYSLGAMYERQYFDYWMNYMVGFQTGLAHYPLNGDGRPITTTTITITQYALDNTPSYAVSLFDAFPIDIASQPVSWADDRIQEIQVTFSYTKWRTATTDSFVLAPVANSPDANNSSGVGTKSIENTITQQQTKTKAAAAGAPAPEALPKNPDLADMGTGNETLFDPMGNVIYSNPIGNIQPKGTATGVPIDYGGGAGG